MPIEVDVLHIGPWLDQYRVTVYAGVYPLLDSGVVGGDVDYGGGDR
jgi:hypothetical protein